MPIVDKALLKLDGRGPERVASRDVSSRDEMARGAGQSSRRRTRNTETIDIVVELLSDVALDDRMSLLEEPPNEAAPAETTPGEESPETVLNRAEHGRDGIDAAHAVPRSSYHFFQTTADSDDGIDVGVDVGDSDSDVDSDFDSNIETDVASDIRTGETPKDAATNTRHRDDTLDESTQPAVASGASDESPLDNLAAERQQPPPSKITYRIDPSPATEAAESVERIAEPSIHRDAETAGEAASQVAADNRSHPVHTGYHETCKRILAEMPASECPVLLLASEDKQAGTNAVVAELLRTLTTLCDDPVLAIDACGNRMRRTFDASAGSQLNSVAEQSASWHQRIIQTVLPGLCLLTADQNESPGQSGEAGQMLDELRARFGLIVIDAGSLDHQHIKAFITAATGSCFLVRLGVTGRDWATRTRDKIRALGNSSPNCILTSPKEVSVGD